MNISNNKENAGHLSIISMGIIQTTKSYNMKIYLVIVFLMCH